MADEAAPKLTLAKLAEQVGEQLAVVQAEVTAVADSAGTALAVTGVHSKDIITLKQEQVKLAQLLNGLSRPPGDAVKPGSLDNVLARLEAMEKAGKQDWGPLFEAYREKLEALGKASNIIADRIASVEDKTGVQPGGPFEDLARDVEQLQAAVARLEHSAAPESQAGSQEILAAHERLDSLAVAIGELAKRQHAMRPVEGGPRSAAGSGPATLVGGVNDKVLRLMDEITSIGKDREAKGGGIRYMFRGIEDAQNAVGAAMRKVRVLLRPEVVSWEHDTTPVLAPPDRDGVVKTVLWSTSKLTMRYVFVDPVDGSEFAIEMVGEGKDNSDKSASKAASMACKYALFQALMIPFEQVDESDGNHVVEENHYRTRLAENRPGNDYAPSVEQPSGGYDPAADRSAMAGAVAPDEDSLMQKAAQAAYYLRQALQQPAEVALPAIKKTKDRVAERGIGHYVVDGVELDKLISMALQNVNAAIAARTGGGAQGVTRSGQQSGEGARAAANFPGAEEPSNYVGSRQEYEDALQALTNPNASEQVADAAMRIVADWERGQQDQANEARDTAVLNPGGTASGDHDY